MSDDLRRWSERPFRILDRSDELNERPEVHRPTSHDCFQSQASI